MKQISCTTSRLLILVLIIYQTYSQCPSQYSYYDSALNQCIPCDYNCQTCASNICIECTPQYYLGNGTTSGTCLPCGYGCSVCSNPNICITCQVGLYLDSSGLCLSCDTGVKSCSLAVVEDCDPGFFRLAQICAGCFANCQKCIDFVTCDQCNIGFFIEIVNGSQACSRCSSNCQVCSSISTCISCVRGYQIINNQCSLQNCKSLNSFCSKCTLTACLQCQQGYYLSSGVCKQGGSLLCLEAVGPSYIDCQTSNYGCASYASIQFDRINNNQMDVCLPKHYTQLIEYVYYITKAISCTPATCSQPSNTNIVLITQPYYKIQYHLNIRLYNSQSHNIIVTNLNSTNLVSKTHSNINITANLLFNDLGCPGCPYGQIILNGQLLAYGYDTTLINISNSISGFSIVQYVFQMYLCKVAKCQQCNTAIDCVRCRSPYLLQLIKCVNKCDAGFYTYIEISLKIRSCLLSCPTGTYSIRSTYQCKTCNSPCLTCIDSSHCLSCINGYFLQNQNCLLSCSSQKLFPNSTSHVCQQCPNPCTTCTISNTSKILCLTCNIGYLLQKDSTCTFLCPNATFTSFVDGKSICSPCSSTCTDCYINDFICSGCITGYLLYQGNQCINSTICQSGYYPYNKALNISTGIIEVINNVCSKCHYPCQQCLGIDKNCLSCRKGSLLESSTNTCPLLCPDGMYPALLVNTSTLKCYQCQNPCLNCQSLTRCLSCRNSTFLYNGQCVTNCSISTFYADYSTQSCVNCIPPCLQCLNNTYCTSCVTGYLDLLTHTCTLQCNITSYISNKSICTQCPNPCSKCFSPFNCTQCILPSIYDNNNCISPTDCTSRPFDNLAAYYVQYYLNSANQTIYGECKLCKLPCQRCNVSSILCDSCVLGYILVTQLSTCVQTCPQSYYSAASNILGMVCLKCSSNCLSCTNISLNCSQCSSGMYLSRINNTFECVKTCPSQYYGSTEDGKGGKCKPCLSPCLLCYNSYLCISCISGLLLYNKNCIKSCPQGTTYDSITQPTQCKACSTGCSTCFNTPDNCTSCVPSYFLMSSNNTCIQSCGSGKYPNLITWQCQSCIEPCLECSSASICKNCILNYYFEPQSQQCLSVCPQGTFANATSNYCDSCNKSICFTCTSSSQNCLLCALGYYHNGTSCVKTCQNGTYPDLYTGVCKGCPYPCVVCTSVTICNQCYGVYKLYLKRCYSQCPIGYYSDSVNICQKCQDKCVVCSSFNTCQQCVSGYYVNLANGTCVTTCPTGTYQGSAPITNYQQCLSCFTNCQDCSNAFSCIRCNLNYTLFNGICLQQCPILHYQSIQILNGISTKQCSSCPQNCNVCINSTYCQQCLNSLIYKNMCYRECPSKTYSFNDQQCRDCISPCNECTSDYACKNCVVGYIYYHQFCLKKCPQDVWYLISANFCQQTCEVPNNKLDTSLFTYKNSLISYSHPKICYTQTQVCGTYQNLVLNNNYCLQSCPQDYYVDRNYKCQKCLTNPSICSNRFKASLKILRNGPLTLVIYFSQKSQIAKIQQIYIQFITTQGVKIPYNYSSYILDQYQMRFIYAYQQLELAKVTITIPYLKSQESEQCISQNIYSSQIGYYKSYISYINPQSVSAGQNGKTNQMAQIPQYVGIPFLNIYCKLVIILLLILLLKNFIIGCSNHLQLLDNCQLFALSLYIEIQYPPILQKILNSLSIVLFNFLPGTNKLPYKFSQSKFIYYNTDSSIVRETLLFVVFLVLLIFCIVVIIAQFIKDKFYFGDRNNEKKVDQNLVENNQNVNENIESNQKESICNKKCCSELLDKMVKRIRYRHLNDLFSLFLAPVLLYAFSLSNSSAAEVFLSILLIGSCALFITIITYKIMTMKKMSELAGLMSQLQPTENIVGLMYTPFSHIRRFLLCSLIGIQPQKPLSSLTLLLVFTILVLVCLIFYQPFLNQITDYISIGMEILLIIYIIFIMLIGLNILNSNANWALGIASVVFLLISITLGLVWLVWLTFYQGWKIFCKKVDLSEVQENPYVNGDVEPVREISIAPNLNEENSVKNQQQKRQQSGHNLILPREFQQQQQQLYSSSNVQKEQFRHWGQDSSQDKSQSKQSRDPPQLLIKMTTVL